MKKKLAAALICALFTSSMVPALVQAEEPAELPALSLPTGDLPEAIEIPEGTAFTEEETAEMDRAMRAYTPDPDSLLQNKAESYYYYSQLDPTAASIYDCIMTVCQNPDVDFMEGNLAITFTDMDWQSDEFTKEVGMAYWACVYDHPELFWLYYEIETGIGWGSSEVDLGGVHDVVFFLNEPYANYRTEMTAFNEAVDAFLADIDTSGSEMDIAKRVHDKLIGMVTYDYASMEPDSTGKLDLAHTAYGALVQNSSGTPNYAVCDGYSLAYEYLLQQLGIECIYIGGTAGDTGTEGGGHAWNMVKLDGSWYEVDSTWDDMGNLEMQLTEDMEGYEYYKEALGDPDYREKLDHYLYNVDTPTITDFVPGEDLYYYTKDGMYKFTMVFPSFHVRDTDTDGRNAMGAVMMTSPTA